MCAFEGGAGASSGSRVVNIMLPRTLRMRGVERSPGVLYCQSETSSRVQRWEVVKVLISARGQAHQRDHTKLQRCDLPTWHVPIDDGLIKSAER